MREHEGSSGMVGKNLSVFTSENATIATYGRRNAFGIHRCRERLINVQTYLNGRDHRDLQVRDTSSRQPKSAGYVYIHTGEGEGDETFWTDAMPWSWDPL